MAIGSVASPKAGEAVEPKTKSSPTMSRRRSAVEFLEEVREGCPARMKRQLFAESQQG